MKRSQTFNLDETGFSAEKFARVENNLKIVTIPGCAVSFPGITFRYRELISVIKAIYEAGKYYCPTMVYKEV